MEKVVRFASSEAAWESDDRKDWSKFKQRRNSGWSESQGAWRNKTRHGIVLYWPYPVTALAIPEEDGERSDHEDVYTQVGQRRQVPNPGGAFKRLMKKIAAETADNGLGGEVIVFSKQRQFTERPPPCTPKSEPFFRLFAIVSLAGPWANTDGT
jgi:hypothetical protein